MLAAQESPALVLRGGLAWKLLHEPRAPWMLGATVRRDRPLVTAARLFPSPPPALAHFLSYVHDVPDGESLEALFWNAAARLPEGPAPGRWGSRSVRHV